MTALTSWMRASTHTVTLPGAILKRGFWLYVWRASTPKGEFLYVGRTGDSSSPFATAAYLRMGQHLGYQRTQNALRRHLESRGIAPELCAEFRMIAHGPLFPQTLDMESHRAPRDKVAALEKALADALSAAGYEVLNDVRCRKPLDAFLWHRVRSAFAPHFPELSR